MKSNAFTIFCYRIMKNYASFLSKYINISSELKMANFKISHLEYISASIMISALAFFFSAVLFSLLTIFFVQSLYGFVPATFFGIFIAFGVGSGTFIAMYLYPHVVISSRKSKIDKTLPFATMYMSTLAGTGTPIHGMFKMLSNMKEYGEISKEFGKIYNEVSSYGSDVVSAINRAAGRTPSERFRDLLWGVSNIVNSGGNLRDFLYEKSRNYIADYRRDLDKFAQNLSLLLEIYITVVIVGSVFLIVLTVIMGQIVANELLIVGLQLAGLFLLLPASSIIFIILIKTISPVE